jgi:hypothetical protein
MERKRQILRLLATSYQLDVTLENAPQILIQLIIVLLATATYTFQGTSGLEAAFDTHDEDERRWSARLLFYLSIAWSVRSIHTSIFSTYLFRKEHTIGDLGKVLMLVKIFLESSSRILAIILSLAPFLGLFNLMLPHHMDTRLAYSQELEIKYGRILSKSRVFTWYTGGLDFQNFLLLLFVFPLIHIVLVTVLKLFLVPQFLQASIGKTGLWSKARGFGRAVIHASSSLLVPTIWRDWDEPSFGHEKEKQLTTLAEFWQAWQSVRREYRVVALLHLAENLMLLWPALLCSWHALLRSYELSQLPEEDALLGLYYTILCSPAWFILSALVQIWLFELYNLKGHPWARLLKQPSSSKTSVKGPF